MDDNSSDIATGPDNELTEQDKEDLASLDQAWKNFLMGMNEAKDVIRKCLQDFKAGMEERIDEFKHQVTENRESFKKAAPFVITKEFEASSNGEAFELIEHFNRECRALRGREEAMQFGLEIFAIEATKYVELALVEQENASLLNIWSIKQEWDRERSESVV